MHEEILFRGKRTDNGEWVTGYYVYNYRHDSHMILFNYNACMNAGFRSRREDFGLQDCEVAPETVCQYTGLTDKKGRKIFEGDIVRDIFKSVVGIVRYGEYRNTFNEGEFGGHIGFYIEWQEKKDLLRKDLVYWARNSEFIGNIFDNSELLEGGAE